MCSLDFAGSLKHDERRTTCLVIQFKQNDLKYENSPCLFLAFRRKLLVMLLRILKKCTFLVVHVKFICLLDVVWSPKLCSAWIGSKLMHHSARSAGLVHDLVKCRRRTSASGLLQLDSWPRPSTLCIFDDFYQIFRQKISKIRNCFLQVSYFIG
jgi:hypothetical protein